MNKDLVFAMLPLIIVAAGSVLVMLAAAFWSGRKSVVALIALDTLAMALIWPAPPPWGYVTPLLMLDRFGYYFMRLIFAASLAVALLADGYLARRRARAGEFYVLLLTATLGAATLAAASHFASFFLGLEILSVSLYGLVAYLRADERSVEAGLKYLILAGVSSAFLLLGMALVYAALGTMVFREMARASATGPDAALLSAGLGLIAVGAGFKLALVPFHLWTPDVYQGAGAPAAAFVATVSKGAVFALLLRFSLLAGLDRHPALAGALGLIAMASMLAGSLLALLQDNVKRILAYSSISHLGSLLVAYLAGGPGGAQAAMFYLAAYFVTMLGAFGVVAALSTPSRDAEAIGDYRALFWRRPWLAAAMTAMLLSLAGIPLTAGFVGKFQVLAAGVSASLWLLTGVLLASSAIGIYYYLRIVVAMASPLEEAQTALAPLDKQAPTPATTATLAALAFLLLYLGIYPAPLIRVILSVLTGWAP